MKTALQNSSENELKGEKQMLFVKHVKHCIQQKYKKLKKE